MCKDKDSPFIVVFLLNSTFPQYAGGRENWLYHVSKGLSDRGHTVHIISIGAKHSILEQYVLPKCVLLHRVGAIWQSLLFRALLPGPFKLFRLLLVGVLSRKPLKKIIFSTDVKPCVVSLDTVVMPIAVRSFRSAITYVCAVKGPHAEVLGNRFPAARNFLKKLELRSYDCDDLWANGKDTQESLSREGYDSHLIGNGVNVKKAEKRREKPNEFVSCNQELTHIVAVGSLLDIKGINEAIKAMAVLMEKGFGKEVCLWFIGKGDVSKYEKVCAAQGVSDSVRFLGNRKDVFPYLQHSAAALCLSGGGGQSMSALEALACGSVVICWETPVYTQMIQHGKNGFLVEHNNVNRLASAILSCLSLTNDEKLMISQSAEESARDFDWQVIVGRIERRLLSANGPK